MRVIKTDIVDSETGEVFVSRTMYGNNNGSGWVVSYLRASELLARRCDSAVTFRIFHLLISRMTAFDGSGISVSRKWIQDTLNVSRKSVYNALQWLFDNDILVETVIDGMSEFFFNPEYVTLGKDRAARVKRYKEIRREGFIKSECMRLGLPYPLPAGLTLEKAIQRLEHDLPILPVPVDDWEIVDSDNSDN